MTLTLIPHYLFLCVFSKMNVTDYFLSAFHPLYFGSYDELLTKMKEFQEESGIEYSIKRSVRLNDDTSNKHIFVYKYIQYVCTSSICQSFINICFSYGTLRIVKYWMVHSHTSGINHSNGVIGLDNLASFSPSTPLTDVIEPYEDGDILTDQTVIFQQHVPMKSFSSFSELEKKLIKFQQTTGCLLVKRNSMRHPHNSPEYETLVYKSLTYACCHYGNGKSHAAKMQQQKTRKMNCPCVIRIGCRGKKLHIIGYAMRHNHPVATNLAENYPENRRLNEEEKLEISKFLQTAPDNLAVKEHIEQKFGKPCTLNDVRQLRYRFRKLQKSQNIPHTSEKSAKYEESRPDELDSEFELPLGVISDWSIQSKEHKLSQFAPYSHQLTELVCAADSDTFCERMEFIKELLGIWRIGKQPMLTYRDILVKDDPSSSMIENEEITSEPPYFIFQRK